MCKDLQLPPSEFAYSADLISINSSSPLKTAPIQVRSSYSSAKLNGLLFIIFTHSSVFLQSICALTVSPDGSGRFWPSLAHEGAYTEIATDLGGNLCNHVAAVKVCSQTESAPFVCVPPIRLTHFSSGW